MVKISACISSGDWQPRFKVAQFFHVNASCSSDRAPNYGFGMDCVYPGSQCMAKHLLCILQVHLSCSQEDMDMVRKLPFTIHSARHGTRAMLEALQQ